MTVNLGICLYLGVLAASGGACAVESETRYAAVATDPGELRPAASQPTTIPAAASTAPTTSTVSLDEQVQLIVGDNTPQAREMGARNLLRAGSDEASRRLADLLKTSTDPAAQRAICRAVIRFDSPAPRLADPLQALFGGQPGGLDELVVEALQKFDAQPIISRFQAMVADTSLDASQRAAAIGALGTMGDDLRAVEALMSIVSGEGDGMRSAALHALGEATGMQHRDAAAAEAWWILQKDRTPDQWMRAVNKRRLAAIRRLRSERVVLLKRLTRAYREAYLTAADGERTKNLLAFLGDDESAIRGLGLDLINALITDRKDVVAEIRVRLVQMIADADEGIRQRVAVMVGDLRLTDAMDRLQQAIAVEQVAEVRAAQVAALGRLDDLEAVAVLIGRLDDAIPDVTREAAIALGMLARRGQVDAAVVERVAAALLKRFEALDVENARLRQPFLEAMGRIGAEVFRPIIQGEMVTDRASGIRCAAISAMSSYGDAAASAEVRPHTSAPQPEIRLAAAQALGRCGRSQADLAALGDRADNTTESNQAVREAAWSAYQAIAKRSSIEMDAAAVFARPGDQAAQRRRLDLLRSLRNDQDRFEALSAVDRLRLAESLADAHDELGELEPAASRLEEAMQAVAAPQSPQYRALALRHVTILLRMGRDEAALGRIESLAPGQLTNGEAADASPWFDVLMIEIRRRLEGATDAAQFAAAFELIRLAGPVSARIAPSRGNDLAMVYTELTAKCGATVDTLLAALGKDAAAESKLLAFGPDVVLSKLHGKLTATQPTSAPDEDREAAWIALAKKFIPTWSAYKPGCKPEERAAALARLILPVGKTKPSTRPQAPTTAPA